LVINLRWIVLAAGALMVERMVSPQALVVAAALIAGCNAAAIVTAASAEAYRRHGLTMAVVTRAGDLIAAALAVRTAQPWLSGAHLLFLFPIIATAYVFGRKDATAGMVGGAVALDTIAVLSRAGWGDVAAPTLPAILARTLVLAAGGLAGSMLRWGRALEVAREGRRAKLDNLAEMQGFVAAVRPAEALRRIAELALRGAGAKQAALFLKATDGRALYMKAAASADGRGGDPSSPSGRAELRGDPPEVRRAGIAADDPVALRVARTGKAMIVAGDEEQALEREESTEPCACAPISRGHSAAAPSSVGDILGVLLVRGKLNPGGFSDDDLTLLRSLAADAALVHVNDIMYDRLREAVWRTISSLANSLEAHDPYTQGHSSRVAMLAALLAREMALEERTVSLLRHAALLHDIGKVGIPDGILRKPASLTPDEWASIKTHPVASEGICRGLDMHQDVLFLIRHHHERLDGSGYPDGLQSHEQPLALRILCVADAFDAMSSDRPYREALSQEARLRELNRLAGVEFDQQVVETLKRLIDQGALEHLYRAPADVAPRLRSGLP
jgi:putative nucleotidyltransferase with HDIG domain